MGFVANEMVKKIILLFVLDKMEIPLTDNSITDIITVRNSWMSYMDCKETLHKLIDVGFIYPTSSSDENTCYNITYEGRDCLSHFFKSIPSSLREQIDNYAKKNRMEFKKNQEYVGDYYKNIDGSYTAVLRISAPLEPQHFFEVKIKFPTKHAALVSVKKWKDNAAHIYETVNEKLTEE